MLGFVYIRIVPLLVEGTMVIPVISPHKGQWRGALMFFFICIWIHDWVNNRGASNLRRYRAHYDVIVVINLLNIMSSNILNNVVNIFAYAIASSASEYDKPSKYRELSRDIRCFDIPFSVTTYRRFCFPCQIHASILLVMVFSSCSSNI